MLKKTNFKQFFVGPLRSSIWGCIFLLLISFVVFFVARYAVRKDCEVRLFREYSKIEDQITNRMQTYANSMLAIRSYLYNFNNTTPQQLNRYVEDMQLFERYPGMRAVGYAEVLSKSEFTDNALRLSQLVSNFSLDQYSSQTGYYAITAAIYPNDLQNQKVLGFDMLSEDIRKSAIINAIETDKPSLSDILTITQDNDDSTQPLGALLFFPVYKQNDPRISRNFQNTSGIVFISLRINDLFGAIFGDQTLIKERIGFTIDMIDKDKRTQKLYSRIQQKISTDISLVRNFDVFGKTLRLSVNPYESFFTTYDILFPYALSLITLLICALIFLNMRSNAQYTNELSTTNNLLNIALRKQKEKQEDLTILNVTLQKMSHSLDTEKIVERFIQGVSEIFENKGKFAIYSAAKSNQADKVSCHLISSNDDAFFVSESIFDKFTYDQLMRMRDDNQNPTAVDLNLLVIHPQQDYRGMVSKIDTSTFGIDAFTVFISTSNEIDESESVLFEALMKHLNTSVQNSQLLKKVEDANQSKSAFLANMSHEIRTPLNALMGFSEMLVRSDIDSETKKELSANIIRNGKQLTRLVDDILDLSKIEAGKLLIVKKKTDIIEVVREIQSIMKLRIVGDRVHFQVEIEGKIPQFIEVDPIRLKQILSNLIGNSIKFTEKGLVRLRISYVIDESTQKSRMVFRVEDTGRGMEKEFRSKLFLPFSQADSTSTRVYGGTGLGLAISKRLANEMGGDLNLVFSERDIGSIFELKIPLDPITEQIWTEALSIHDAKKDVTQPEQHENLIKKKILLVEDSQDNQDFFNFFLTKAGCDVKIIDNGLDAVDEANKNNYDIILMDIQIPGIDGKEATRRIRKDGYHGPIVALTAHAMLEEQSSCIKAGCNGQISKPVSGETLVSQVSEFIRGNHATTT